MAECNGQLDAIRDALADVNKDIGELREQILTIMAGQSNALVAVKEAHQSQIDSLNSASEAYKETLRKEAEILQRQMLGQAEGIQNVSSAIISLQRTVSKYAAAGALLGAVLLYIFAKATGL